MTGEQMNDIESYISCCIERSNRVCIKLESFEYDGAFREVSLLANDIQMLLTKIMENEAGLRELGLLPDYNYLLSCIGEINNAQAGGDGILLSDILRCSFFPYLSNLIINCQQVWERREEAAFENNLLALKESQPEVYNLVVALMEKSVDMPEQLVFETTNTGLRTIKQIEDDNSFYLYSNDNPMGNVFRWVHNEIKLSDSEIKDSAIEEYHILGFDLGYICRGVSYFTKELYPIHCYETNPAMLIYALRYHDYTNLLRKNLKIHFDPLLTEFTTHIEDKRCKVILYPPRVRMIENADVRNSYMKYLTAQASVREQAVLLNGNFLRNIKRTDYQNVDEIKTSFAGREVYIVAAGPSLDKNFRLLKDMPDRENKIIFATGTVFKKLIKAGIRPDYIIISEANERVIAQIEGYFDETIPLILLSTATWRLYESYKGPKYMVYQYEFTPAEKAAEAKGRKLYMTGGSVSTTALDVAIRLGAEKIVFLGLDLAYTDGAAHCHDTSRRDYADNGEMIMTQGYDGKEVVTDSKFMLYNNWFKRRLEMDDVKKVEIIDATEGGAIIPGMKCMTLAEVISG